MTDSTLDQMQSEKEQNRIIDGMEEAGVLVSHAQHKMHILGNFSKGCCY